MKMMQNSGKKSHARSVQPVVRIRVSFNRGAWLRGVMHTAEFVEIFYLLDSVVWCTPLSFLKIRKLGEIEKEFENILDCLSGIQMGSNHEKNRGIQSCDTLPLSAYIKLTKPAGYVHWENKTKINFFENAVWQEISFQHKKSKELYLKIDNRTKDFNFWTIYGSCFLILLCCNANFSFLKIVFRLLTFDSYFQAEWGESYKKSVKLFSFPHS